MTKTIIKYFVVLAMTFESSVLWAAGETTSSDTASSGVESKGTQPTNKASVKASGDKASSENKMAQASQYLSGALMFTMAAQKYGECSSQNYSACAMAAIFTGMGVLSMAQGAQHGKTASSAGMTAHGADGLGNNPYDYGDMNLQDPNNPLSKDPNISSLTANTKKLQSGGFLNAKTGKITLPNGKTFKPSDFASKSAMEAAGIPKGAIDGAMAAYSEIQKKTAAKVEKLKLGALTAAGGFEEGGGGGGAASSTGEAEDSDSAMATASSGGVGAGFAADRDPSSLAGMQKNYNGEPIGVAADSIFLMMNRRYKVKESQESFFTEADLALQK